MKIVVLILTALLAAASFAFGPFLGETAALFLLPGVGWVVAAEFVLMFIVITALFIDSLYQHWHASPVRLLGWGGGLRRVRPDAV